MDGGGVVAARVLAGEEERRRPMAVRRHGLRHRVVVSASAANRDVANAKVSLVVVGFLRPFKKTHEYEPMENWSEPQRVIAVAVGAGTSLPCCAILRS